MTHPTTETVMLAYLRAACRRTPDMTLTDALHIADDIAAELVATPAMTAPVATAGGGTAGTEQEQDLALLRSLFAETGEAINAAAFAEAAEIDKDDALQRLYNLAGACLADQSRRGRGIYFTPVE